MAKAKEKEQPKEVELFIKPPNFQLAQFLIVGDAPYVQNAFSKKAKEQIRTSHAEGSTRKKGSNKEAKNFDECFREAMHTSTEGWHGIPASSFRAAMISACRMVGYKMTYAKLALFVVADGFDKEHGDPLVRITKGEPQKVEHIMRIQKTIDYRVRAMWKPGWEALVTIKYDADQFKAEDVANLFMRVGQQVGIGEGRPDSKDSAGCGWGTFVIKGKGENK